MDYDDYRKWLKPTRGDKLATKYIQTARQFEDFLRTERSGRPLELATTDDFQEFAETAKQQFKRRREFYWYVYNLYLFLGNEEMMEGALRLRAEDPDPTPIRKLAMVKSEHKSKLLANGISTNLMLLDKSKTPQDREELARSLAS